MPKYASADQIKVAVVGYSGAFGMGRAHLNEMAKAGMVPTAVVELSEDLRKQAKKDFPGITTYANLGTMLSKCDVDLVAIITPHNTHAKLALQCLKAGKHVVCEKPLAITTGECDAMIAAAKENGVVLSTYHNRHWDGCILKAVEEIRGGAIGDVVRIEAHMGGYGKPGDWWRSSKTISGGIMYDWGVHVLEYSLQLLDGDMVEVSGYAKNGYWADQTKWGKDTNEDEGQAVVRFSNGQWLTLTISQLDSNPKRGVLEITGTKGTYIMDHGSYEVISRNEKGESTVRRGGNPAGEGWKLYQNIADHLIKGEELIITPEWARRPIHILDLADRSAKQGRAQLAKYK
ncbi:MAG: Gfo/Idh/MocA family protein [Armatimonadota bacterium]